MNARLNIPIDTIIPFFIFCSSYFFNFPVSLSLSGSLNANPGKNSKISIHIEITAWIPKNEKVSMPFKLSWILLELNHIGVTEWLFLQVRNIYLPTCWVDLSSNSRVTVKFLLLQNERNLTPLRGSRWNSHQHSTWAYVQISLRYSRVRNRCRTGRE